MTVYAGELPNTAVKVDTCAPGTCATDLNDHRGGRTPAQGAVVAIGPATFAGDGAMAASSTWRCPAEPRAYGNETPAAAESLANMPG